MPLETSRYVLLLGLAGLIGSTLLSLMTGNSLAFAFLYLAFAAPLVVMISGINALRGYSNAQKENKEYLMARAKYLLAINFVLLLAVIVAWASFHSSYNLNIG